MGPPKAEDALREALAIGADDAILISDRKLAGSDTLATSYVLEKAVRRIKDFDLVLCGMETSDGGTGQVGPEVAEFLGIPQVSYVENVEIDKGYAKVKRLTEGGYEMLQVKLPALLTITNTSNQPRSTSFAGIVQSMKKSVSVLSVSDLELDPKRIGLSGSPTKLMKIEKRVSSRKRLRIEKKSPESAVDELLEQLQEDGVCLSIKNE
jgi:electron transfer flavoprotein beta subunit